MEISQSSVLFVVYFVFVLQKEIAVGNSFMSSPEIKK